MSTLRAFFVRFRAHFRHAQLDRDLDAELSSHLALALEENLRSGMSPAEARRVALLHLGGLEQTKESVRHHRSLPWLETALQDLSYGVRQLRKNPGFTVVALLTLALGIGANTAIFSLVNGILLVSLPYPKAEQLVSVTGAYPQGAFVAMRKQTQTMDVAAYAEGHEFNLTGQGEALRLTGTMVSAELLSVLGARPELGRTFISGDDIPGHDAFVILSRALWQQRFGGDPGMIGRSIELEGANRQVIGVMPADFRFPSTKTEIWVPLHSDPRSVYTYWAGDYMPVIGRLRPGSTLLQARTEIRMFQSHVGELFPWHMPAAWNANVSVIALQSGLVADVRVRLLLLLAAVALVLLIACTNVANLTLSRAATREKEVALRSALGASRHRIMRQLLTESVLLASMGALLGLVFAFEGLSLLKNRLPKDTPRLMDVHMDWRVLAFTAALAILTGLVAGLAPALHISRGALSPSLKSSGRGTAASVSRRLRGGLVVGELALAVLLVIAAGLMIRSFWALSHVNPGFRSEHILTARITPNQSFCSDAVRCVAFYCNVLDQVRSLPGVRGAAVVNTLPLGGRVAKRSLDLEDHIDPSGEVAPLFWLNVVTPGYFRVMGIPLLSGREFTDSDVSGTAVAVITAETARRYWPNQSPLGKSIRLLDDKTWRTIVGVISDVRAYDLQRNTPNWIDGTAYVPYNPSATLEDRRVPSEMTIAIRTASDDSQIATMLRDTVASLNHEVPVSEVKTMAAVVSEAASAPASTTTLFIAFAALAMLLGIIGIYGVLTFLVSQRTRELGVRIALGALPGDILVLVMKEGAKFSFAGIAVGLTAAILVTRVMSSELYGVSPLDPPTYLLVALLMAAVTLLACYVPTRRAMRVDPITALRYE